MRTSGRPCETAATQPGSPGSNDAVCPSGPSPTKCDVEKRALRIKRCSAVGLLQCLLVTPRRVLRSAVGRNRINVLGRHLSFGEHRFARHPINAVGMIVRDEALVAPVPGNARPGETPSEFIRGERSIPRLRRRSARERDAERAGRRLRGLRHPFRGGWEQPAGEGVVDQVGTDRQKLHFEWMLGTKALQGSQIVAVAKFREQILQDSPIAITGVTSVGEHEVILQILLYAVRAARPEANGRTPKEFPVHVDLIAT